MPFDAACQWLWFIDRDASDNQRKAVRNALRTSALLLDSVKPYVISLNVTGMLNIHGKRLNIWINMHISCWHAHMDVHSIVPIGFAIKTTSVCFCPFHFAHRQVIAASSLLRRIITNEPVCECFWVVLSRPWSSHESSFIDFSDQTNALWSFFSTPTSSLRPPTSAHAGCLSSMEGHVCLFPSNWSESIPLFYLPQYLTADWFMNSSTLSLES